MLWPGEGQGGRAEGTGQAERETDMEEAVEEEGQGTVVWRGPALGSFCVSRKRVAPAAEGLHLTALHWWLGLSWTEGLFSGWEQKPELPRKTIG